MPPRALDKHVACNVLGGNTQYCAVRFFVYVPTVTATAPVALPQIDRHCRETVLLCKLAKGLHGCRWARKGVGKDTEPPAPPPAPPDDDWEHVSLQYSPLTMKSLELIDAELLNYDLLEALVLHIVQTQAVHGPGALLQVSEFSAQLPAGPRLFSFPDSAQRISRSMCMACGVCWALTPEVHFLLILCLSIIV